jgi:TRAP-type C4-dicarboxylate transport system substrate-binding protein
MMGCGMMIITDAAWAKLDESQQTALQAAFDAASAYNQEISASAEESSRTVCENAGATFTEVPDKTPWQEAVTSVIEENTSSADLKEVYEAIQALA